MSDNLAAQYADSLMDEIRENDDAGTPFGVVSDDNPVLDRENGDDVTAMDYISDALDIQYIVNSDRSYRAGRVLLAFGGPNVWINTQTAQLEVSWWSAPEYRELPAAFVEGVDGALAELWEA